VLRSDLTAIVFSNLLWFLLTLCLGSVLVTRQSRPERDAPARRGLLSLRLASASWSRAAPGRWPDALSLAATGASAAEELAADEEFATGHAFRVSDYLVLSDYPLGDEELAADDDFADDVITVSGATMARDRPDAVASGRLAPLPLAGWSDTDWTGRAPARRAPGPARHRRPRPARGKALAQAAAVAIAVVIVGAGAGLGLRLASGGGHAPAAQPAGGLAGDVFAGTAPPAITQPVTRRVMSPDHTTWLAHLAGSGPGTLRGRLHGARAQLAATLNMIRFLGHDMGAGNDARLVLPALTRQAAMLRAEIARIEQRPGAATRRRPAAPIRLTSVTRHLRRGGGGVRPRPPVARVPAGEAGRRAAAVAYAEAQLGKPYVWGGAGPYGFDCSGLVMMAWQADGVSLPHFTGSQWADTYHITAAQLRPGDLVFSNGFGHVQLYVGHGEVIQAPYTGQVVSYSPLPPPAVVDGYASVFPPGHPAAHPRRPGPARHHRARPHRPGGQRRRHHSHRSARGRRRAHAHRHRPCRHRGARRHHRNRVVRHHRARAHHGRGHRHRRACRHHHRAFRHHRALGHHHRPCRDHRPCRHHRSERHHRIRRHHPVCGHRRTWRPHHRTHCGRH
jgi:cell wall-associated NlpC family hydrolase